MADEVVYIPLTKGFKTLVDRSDCWVIQLCSWNTTMCRGRPYARGRIAKQDIYLHRFLANAPDSMEVDHRNRDNLDNRRSNLRLATRQNNIANRVFTPTKGVYPDGDKWRARIGYNDGRINIGSYDTVEEAIEAYNRKAEELFGEFACLNIY